MWCVTSNATFGLQRCVFVSKWTLFVSMTLDARSIAAGGESCLLEFETAMWVMAIATLHRAFENFVMEGHIERGLDLTMTTQAKLRLSGPQHVERCEAWFFGICRGHASNRARHIPGGRS